MPNRLFLLLHVVFNISQINRLRAGLLSRRVPTGETKERRSALRKGRLKGFAAAAGRVKIRAHRHVANLKKWIGSKTVPKIQ